MTTTSSVSKRALDVVTAGTALLALSPLMLAAAAAVALTTGRPVLYRDVRAGRDGRPFEMLKFRTMRELRPGETIPEHDEIRTTRVGAVLRSTSIDELPSLWNIFIGDMSLVGPRPLPIRYVQRYDEHQRRRLEVRPGLTGLAQASGRNALSWDERFDLDVQYVDHHSMRVDVNIMAKTLLPVLGRRDTQADDGAAMPEFTGTGTPEADASS